MRIPIRKALATAALAACLSLLPASALALETKYAPVENTAVKIYMDGQALNLKNNTPIVVNDRLLLPLRVIFEGMNATVDWDNETKSVTSTRYEDTLKISLNNQVAWKNGAGVTLDVPLIAYKDRTYVPVRFVGEAFGAQVNYDSATKQVQIKTDGRTAKELKDLKINLNGVDITFKTSPILHQGIRYIPLDEILDKMAEIIPENDNFHWSKNGDDYHIYFDRVEKTFSLASTASMQYPPIVYNNVAYAPLRIVEELVGGQVYASSDGIIYYYINRVTLKHPFVPFAAPASVFPISIPAAELQGNRLLMVSDNPEVLTPDTIPEENCTLWESNNVSFKNVSLHRVFGWHISQLSQNARIGVVIENTGDCTLTITNAIGFGKDSENAWGSYDVGLPLADAILGQLTTKSVTDGAQIEVGDTLLLQTYNMYAGYLLGFTNDFDINATGANPQYKVRVVISTDSRQDLSKITADALDTSYQHPRGNWASSVVFAQVPTFTTSNPEICYSISNGITDNLYTKEASFDNGFATIANPGHFGASYKLRIPVYNDSNTEQKVSFRLSARGGQYTGAVKNPEGVFLIPTIKPSSDTAELYLYTAPPGNSTVELEIIHAGASTLAVALDIITVDESMPIPTPNTTDNQTTTPSTPIYDPDDPMYQYQNNPDEFEVQW